MSKSAQRFAFAFALMALTAASPGNANAHSVAPSADKFIRLCPGPAPGSEDRKGDEVRTTQPGPGGPIHLVTNVTVPGFTVFRPAAGKANGAGMLVLPGGGFAALVWDIEGTEVANWLADRGITAFLLKYRVGIAQATPATSRPDGIEGLVQSMRPGRELAIADVAQAIRLIRKDAERYGVKRDRVGMIGFSAGAITTVDLILGGPEYARPDFAAPIYGFSMPAAPIVPANAPPIFMAGTQDDWVALRGLDIFDLWTKAKRPAELHMYPKGGHGYGVRLGLPASRWTEDFHAWLGGLGMLTLSAHPLGDRRSRD